MREDTLRAAGEEQQQIKFLRSKMHLVAANLYQVLLRINFKITSLYMRGGRLEIHRSAELDPYTGKQFLNTKWLGDVIVRSFIERLNFRALLIAHRNNDDGSGARRRISRVSSTPSISGMERSVITRSGWLSR